jgi:outer membrane protein assembly factor BamA
MAGTISGNPPLFERFSLGNSATLRGWNKYDIDPIGGTRVVHFTTEWSWHHVGAFLDNGSIWSAGQESHYLTSLGVNLGPLKLAFPIHCANNCGVTFLIHFE